MIKKFIALVTATLIICNFNVISAYANDNSYEERLKPYIELLQNFNTMYDCDFSFDSLDDYEENSPEYIELQNQFDNICDMSNDEFWTYLVALNNRSSTDNTSNDDNIYIQINAMSDLYEQRHYYDGNSSRYIYFYTTLGYANGTYRYSSLEKCGSYIGNDDYYLARTIIECTKHSITNSGRNITLTYTYKKHISKALIYTAVFEATITFEAGGDDIWNYPTT